VACKVQVAVNGYAASNVNLNFNGRRVRCQRYVRHTAISVHSITAALPANANNRSRVEKPGSNVIVAQINMPNAVLAVSESMLCCSTLPTAGYLACSSARQTYPNRPPLSASAAIRFGRCPLQTPSAALFAAEAQQQQRVRAPAELDPGRHVHRMHRVWTVQKQATCADVAV
jgi:hypothetical protein